MQHSILPAVRMCLVGFFVVLVFAGQVFSAEPVEVSAVEVREMMTTGEAVVVYPLSPVEYNNLHIEGSVNIPLARLPLGLPEDRSLPLVFYCLGRT